MSHHHAARHLHVEPGAVRSVLHLLHDLDRRLLDAAADVGGQHTAVVEAADRFGSLVRPGADAGACSWRASLACAGRGAALAAAGTAEFLRSVATTDADVRVVL